MDCPACGTSNSRVLDTFKSVEDRRKRTCICGARWDTTETVDKGSLRIATSPYQFPPVSTNGNRSRRVTPNPDGSQPLASGGVGGGLSGDRSDLNPEPSPDPSGDPPQRVDREGVWGPDDWLRRFGEAWSLAFCRGARHYGHAGDGKACGALADLLAELPTADLLAAQERASAMFAEFFADRSRELVKARHCFSWFVGRWGGLRVPAVAAVAPPKPWAAPEPPRADPNCKGWHAGGKNTGRQNPRGQQAGCPECKSVYLRSWTADDRPGEPTAVGELIPGGGPA